MTHQKILIELDVLIADPDEKYESAEILLDDFLENPKAAGFYPSLKGELINVGENDDE